MYTILGKNLRSLRVKKGMTASVVANACGTSRSYITLIENGQRLPGKKLIPKIAASLKVSTVAVLNWYLEDISQEIKRNLG